MRKGCVGGMDDINICLLVQQQAVQVQRYWQGATLCYLHISIILKGKSSLACVVLTTCGRSRCTAAQKQDDHLSDKGWQA
jgi:hypothetical protein